MTNYHHHVNVQTGEKTKVPCTAEEELAIEESKAVYLAETPMREWKYKISKTDNGMPRSLEDHIKDDHDGVAGNEFLQGKYDDKRALRSERP